MNLLYICPWNCWTTYKILGCIIILEKGWSLSARSQTHHYDKAYMGLRRLNPSTYNNEVINVGTRLGIHIVPVQRELVFVFCSNNLLLSLNRTRLGSNAIFIGSSINSTVTLYDITWKTSSLWKQEVFSYLINVLICKQFSFV